jgi:O-antigen ligase
VARPSRAAPGTTPPPALPGEAAGAGWPALLLALMLFLAPALGVPSELMLQDTLKSIVVAFCTLTAALCFFLGERQRRQPLRWHAVVWLPLLLMAYALGSMAWSHRYLAGVEAIRWFLFALLVWLGLNLLTRERLRTLAIAVHAGAVVASLWTALQFWFDFGLFPQGPNPGSTFVNRNFFAEFAVCTLPFGALLFARARGQAAIAALAVSNGFVITAILMTGTRAALIALWLQLLLVLPLIAWRCRAMLAFPSWPRSHQLLGPALLLVTVAALGAIPSGNARVLAEERGGNALQRGLNRTQSIGPADHSLGIRMIMWRATLVAIEARPLTGVGAGAWESEIPRYQAEGSQLETDYYVHNEFLQLVAEYGLVAWAFLLLLAAYLLLAAWRSWRADSRAAQEDQPWRAVLLCSLLALMIVSSIGFPWRLAATGALFALCLGALAASDARLGWGAPLLLRPLAWSARRANAALLATAACLALALFIMQRAAESERKLVEAAKIAVTISSSGRPNDPAFDPAKREMLQLVREGIAINPHYRKITPMVADELARWGDWNNATWIWESVLQSRPYVVAMIGNVARGHSTLGDNARALAYLERARRIQPRAPSVRSLEVILLARAGQEARAKQEALQSLQDGIYDYDLVNVLFILAQRARDFPLAERMLRKRMEEWPESRPRGLVQLGALQVETGHPDRALAAFRQGLSEATPGERAMLLGLVPAAFREQLQPARSTPAGTQTSASSK